jgi:starch phosphorylase
LHETSLNFFRLTSSMDRQNSSQLDVKSGVFPTPMSGQREVHVEDDRTGVSTETLKRAIADNLYYTQGKDECFATPHDYYMALAHSIRDRLLQRRIETAKTYAAQDTKMVYYLSAEFLMGRYLSNSLINLGLYERIRDVMHECGLELDYLLEREEDPGLGNGGLGRLAACFLDSLATLNIPAVGHGIRYEYGIFTQVLSDGWQVELPDKWLSFGTPWEIARPEYRAEVNLGGHTETYTDDEGRYRVRWVPEQVILGIPHDTPVPGYDTDNVNILRLWKAEASESFNLQAFNAGDYFGAVASKMISENISKVLYPSDETPQGKELRLQQQYFFVTCALQDAIRLHFRTHDSLDNFHEKAAIQLNDTHPAVAIAELMRLLLDEYGYTWDKAWFITQRTFGYTNHTLLPEALEKWSVKLFGRLLPRHLQIIYEINHRFLAQVKALYPKQPQKLATLSLIEENGERQVRMAHLACVGSHAINGVAALHTELLKSDVLKDFYELYPEKFNNKTNGVTPRRWLLMSNPKLANLITEKVGTNWVKHLTDLKGLEAYGDDPEFKQQWLEIKQANKEKLASYIKQHNGIEVNPNSIFDIQVKRIHEYKRQLMNALHIIALYKRIQANPDLDIVPRTFIFGGKAAPGYHTAKMIIKLITSIAEVVNHDPVVKDRIKVIFLADFNVSLGQIVYPAADLSEQISTAGKEASGTGNMKFALNGALTIGTLDGANIEIRREVGEENFFLFGMTAAEVTALKAEGYKPWDVYQNNPELKAVLDGILAGEFSPDDPHRFEPLIRSLLTQDPFMLLADFQAYADCQEKVDKAYRDHDHWLKMSILNSARTGIFSSDRTIEQYCQDIWDIEPVPVNLEEYQQAGAGLNLICQLRQSIPAN